MKMYSTMVSRKKMKMKMKKISSTNQQLSASENANGTNASQIFKNVYLIPLKANHQIFSILTTCHIFFLPERTLLLEMVQLLNGNLSSHAGINAIENVVDKGSLSTDEITNSHAQLLFT